MERRESGHQHMLDHKDGRPNNKTTEHWIVPRQQRVRFDNLACLHCGRFDFEKIRRNKSRTEGAEMPLRKVERRLNPVRYTR